MYCMMYTTDRSIHLIFLCNSRRNKNIDEFSDKYWWKVQKVSLSKVHKK